MPNFKFGLQRVLDIRSHREEQIKTELAEQIRIKDYEESVLWSLKETLSDYMDKLSGLQRRESIGIEEILWYYTYILKLEKDIVNQKKRLDKIEERIRETTQRLIKASQERRVLERLKERRLQEFRLWMEACDQAFMDELGIINFVRGQNQLSYKE